MSPMKNECYKKYIYIYNKINMIEIYKVVHVKFKNIFKIYI